MNAALSAALGRVHGAVDPRVPRFERHFFAAANNADAQIVHEAAIGRINNDQLLKLMTFGMNEQEAENIIIEGFLA